MRVVKVKQVVIASAITCAIGLSGPLSAAPKGAKASGGNHISQQVAISGNGNTVTQNVHVVNHYDRRAKKRSHKQRLKRKLLRHLRGHRGHRYNRHHRSYRGHGHHRSKYSGQRRGYGKSGFNISINIRR